MYWLAPLSGTVLATLLYVFVFKQDEKETNPPPSTQTQSNRPNVQSNITRKLNRQTQQKTSRPKYLVGMI